MLARDTYKYSKTWHTLNPVQKVIMITLIMMVNHEDGEWWDQWSQKWMPVKRGQVVTSLQKLADACGPGVTVQNVRTALKTLEKMGFLTNHSTKQNRLITLVNYDFYQTQANYLTKRSTKQPQSNHKGSTTNKHIKHDKQKNIYGVVVGYLNEKIGTNYKATTKATQRLIDARLNEGFMLDDFKRVIDNMAARWKGTEYEQYLRPQTLFGTKFESYLNQSTNNGIKKPSTNPESWQVIR